MVKLRCKYTFVKVRKCERLESIDIQKAAGLFWAISKGGSSIRLIFYPRKYLLY